MSNPEPMEYERATFSEVIRYGFGGIGSNIPFILTLQFLMFFLTDHAGINAAAVGGLFMVARLIDAITDPLMGMFADRTENKRGKYRPYLIFVAPLLGVFTTMLFWSPDVSMAGKVAYIYIVYILYSLISTMVNIPYHSLTPVLSQDPIQRTTIATFKQVLGILGTLFVAAGAVPITKALGNDANSWTIFAAASGIILTLSFWVCASGAKKSDAMANYAKHESASDALRLTDQLMLITKNRALLMLMIAFGTDMIAFAASQAVNIYYFTYAIKRPDLIMQVAMFGTLISVIVAAFIPLLSKTFGKKRIFIFGSAFLMTNSACLYFVPFSNVSLVFTLSLIATGFAVLTGVVGWAMLADCVDYGEWKTGHRGAGTVSSQLTFINKLGMAVGGFLGGVVLSSAGYVAGVEQTEQTLQAILEVKTILPVAGYICSLISMAFYPITNEFFEKMITENEARVAALNE